MKLVGEYGDLEILCSFHGLERLDEPGREETGCGNLVLSKLCEGKKKQEQSL